MGYQLFHGFSDSEIQMISHCQSLAPEHIADVAKSAGFVSPVSKESSAIRCWKINDGPGNRSDAQRTSIWTYPGLYPESRIPILLLIKNPLPQLFHRRFFTIHQDAHPINPTGHPYQRKNGQDQQDQREYDLPPRGIKSQPGRHDDR